MTVHDLKAGWYRSQNGTWHRMSRRRFLCGDRVVPTRGPRTKSELTDHQRANRRCTNCVAQRDS